MTGSCGSGQMAVGSIASIFRQEDSNICATLRGELPWTMTGCSHFSKIVKVASGSEPKREGRAALRRNARIHGIQAEGCPCQDLPAAAGPDTIRNFQSGHGTPDRKFAPDPQHHGDTGSFHPGAAIRHQFQVRRVELSISGQEPPRIPPRRLRQGLAQSRTRAPRQLHQPGPGQLSIPRPGVKQRWDLE